MSTDDSFFSRWSRRKSQVRSGEAVPEPTPTAPAAPLAPPTTAATVGAAAAAVPVATAPAAAVAPAPEAPLPTLDDVATLTPESDFRPFVARAVDPQVRNAAMKTLFSDPHFNVMDGLDIYIDDYSQPNPLPLELARRLTSAQFMKVFDAPEAAPEAAPAAAPEAAPAEPTAPALTAAPAEVPAHAIPAAPAHPPVAVADLPPTEPPPEPHA